MVNKTAICKDVFGNEYETEVRNLQQRVGVYAVIVKDGKILLTRQWDGYSLVGGGVDKGESLEEAFVREIKEETGLDATPGKQLHHATTFFKKNDHSDPVQSFQFYFTAETVSGEISNDGITDSEGGYTNDVAEWIDLADTKDIELRHSVDMATILRSYEINRE